MTIINVEPDVQYERPTEAGNYAATLLAIDDPIANTYNGKESMRCRTIWRFAEFADDIHIYINVSSRHERGNFAKLYKAMTGATIPKDGQIDARPWINQTIEVVYGTGNNPNDPSAIGVIGFVRPRPQRRPTPITTPAPVLDDDGEEAPF